MSLSTTQKLLGFLQSETLAERVAGLQFLYEHPDLLTHPEVGTALRNLEQDREPLVRFWLRKLHDLQNLHHLRGPERGAAPVGPMKSPITAPKARPPRSKTKIRHYRFVSVPELILQLQKTTEQAEALSILQTLFDLGDPAARAPLTAYLESLSDPVLIGFVTKHLGTHFPGEPLLDTLKPFLDHSDERVVANTLEGIEAIGSPSCIPLLSGVLGHANHRIRAAAARAISRFRPDESFRTLAAMLALADQPNQVISACDAIKRVPSRDFLPLLLRLIPEPVVGPSALDAAATIVGQGITETLETLPEWGNQRIRAPLYAAVLSGLIRRKPPQENPWAPLAATTAAADGTVSVEIHEQKTFALTPRISAREAEKLAFRHRPEAFRDLAGLFSLPPADEIELFYSETRLEPFWHVQAKSTVDFTCARTMEIPVADGISEVKIGEGCFTASRGLVMVSLQEHGFKEIQREYFFDAHSGKRTEAAAYLAFPVRAISSASELRGDEAIVVAARFKAPMIIRELLSDLHQPVQAQEINDERLLVQHLNLYYRPIYAFEFLWKPRGEKRVLEIDGLTKTLVPGTTFRRRVEDILDEETLFEIGTEAAGLLIPGSDLALKIARKLLKKTASHQQS